MMKNRSRWTAVLLCVTMGACATRTSQTTGECRDPTPLEWTAVRGQVPLLRDRRFPAGKSPASLAVCR